MILKKLEIKIIIISIIVKNWKLQALEVREEGEKKQSLLKVPKKF